MGMQSEIESIGWGIGLELKHPEIECIGWGIGTHGNASRDSLAGE